MQALKHREDPGWEKRLVLWPLVLAGMAAARVSFTVPT